MIRCKSNMALPILGSPALESRKPLRIARTHRRGALKSAERHDQITDHCIDLYLICDEISTYMVPASSRDGVLDTSRSSILFRVEVLRCPHEKFLVEPRDLHPGFQGLWNLNLDSRPQPSRLLDSM